MKYLKLTLMLANALQKQPDTKGSEYRLRVPMLLRNKAGEGSTWVQKAGSVTIFVTTWEVLYVVTDTQLCQVLGAMILVLEGGLLVQKEHK